MQNLWVAGSAWKVQYGRCAGQKGVAAWSDMRALRGATRGRGSLVGCLSLHCQRMEVNAATLGAPGHFGAIESNHIVAGMDRRVHGNNAGLQKEGLEFTDSDGMVGYMEGAQCPDLPEQLCVKGGDGPAADRRCRNMDSGRQAIS